MFQRRVRRTAGGTDLVADVQAVIAANVGGKGSRSAVSANQRATARQGGDPSPPDEEERAR